MLQTVITRKGIPKQAHIMKKAYDCDLDQMQKQNDCSQMYPYSHHFSKGGIDNSAETTQHTEKRKKSKYNKDYNMLSNDTLIRGAKLFPNNINDVVKIGR